MAADAIRVDGVNMTTTTTGTTSTILGECMRNCTNETYSVVYCEASVPQWGLDVSCMMADNECEARCLLKDGMEQAKEDSPEYAALIDAAGVDYVYDRFCDTESCMNSTSDPTTTETCDEDARYWRTDCPDESGSGCSIKFNVTLDVCQLGRQFSRNAVYGCMKNPFVSVVEDTFDYLNGICGESDLSISAYRVDYLTDWAPAWGQRDVTTDADCEDLTAVCGDSLGEHGFALFASISFYCGDCDELLDLYTELLAMMDANEFDAKYTAQVLEESVSEDSICLDGFGSIEVADYSLAVEDEDGDEIFVVQPGGAAEKSVMVAGVLLAFIFSL